MQPITKEELEKLIEEAKAEGKDTATLERALHDRGLQPKPESGEEKKVGNRWITSTGPAKSEDFDD